MLVPALLHSYWPIAVWGATLLCMGYTAGWLIARRVSRQRVARDTELALARLREVAASVAEGVGSHATRVLEITSEVDATRADGVPSLNEIIRDSLADVVLANELLQEQLKGATDRLERQAAEIEAQAAAARIDALTGLCNRRGFEEELNRRYAEWLRQGRVCSLLLIDLALFRGVDDRNGHRASDDVLRALGRLLPCAIREMDVAIRYGAQEFAIILPGTNVHEALAAAERLRSTLVEAVLKLSRENVHVLVSVGVAQVQYEVGVTRFVARAEAALSAAKATGRDSTFFHDGKTCLSAEQVPPADANAEIASARAVVRKSD